MSYELFLVLFLLLPLIALAAVLLYHLLDSRFLTLAGPLSSRYLALRHPR